MHTQYFGKNLNLRIIVNPRFITRRCYRRARQLQVQHLSRMKENIFGWQASSLTINLTNSRLREINKAMIINVNYRTSLCPMKCRDVYPPSHCLVRPKHSHLTAYFRFGLFSRRWVCSIIASSAIGITLGISRVASRKVYQFRYKIQMFVKSN